MKHIKMASVGLICFMLGAGILNAIGTRTITDTSDTIYTTIMTSMGGSEPATLAGFKTALYSLNSTGGTVQLPACNISITHPIYPESNIVIRGVGENTILFLAAASSCDMFVVDENNVTFEYLHINMNNFSQVYGTHNAIYLDTGSFDCRVRHCSFIHGVWHYINTISWSGQGRHVIEDNQFYEKHRDSYGGAVMMRGSKNIVRNNFAKDTFAFGFGVEGSELITYDNLFDGNVVTGFVGVGIYCENEAAANTTIVNNIITNIFSTAYIVSENYYSIGIHAGKGNIVSNNRITGVSECGIYVNGNATITGNKIYNVNGTSGTFASAGSGIIVANYITDRDFSLITGNIIENTANSAIVASSNCSIVNCHIRNVSGANNRGIEIVTGTAYCVSISNCRIENVGSSAGIHVEATRCRVSITDNYILNIAQRGIYVVTSSGGVIEGNTVEKTGLEGIYLLAGGNSFTVNGNWINYTNAGAADGIRIAGSNITVDGNVIRNADEAIELDGPASNVSATDNRAFLCNSGFLESGACKYNFAEGNNFRGCTVPYTIVGTGSYATYINGTTRLIAIVNSGGTRWI